MIAPGLRARTQLLVTSEDTAAALGSGDVPVLGTPRVVTAFEAATVEALRAHLDDGKTSVGTRVAIDHQRGVPVGDTVVVTAQLVSVDGRLLQFDVAAVDEQERLVASGRVTRVVVDRERFLARVQSASA
jgi:fluoroacetyl-CoA thioesterase